MTEKKTKVRVASFSISLDGYGAAANQSLDNPMGMDEFKKAVHEWVFSTHWWSQIIDYREGGTEGIDNDFLEAWIRKSRCLDYWQEHVRAGSRPMARHELEGLVGKQSALSRSGLCANTLRKTSFGDGGGTTFYFITEGIHDALAKAREAAAMERISGIGGGASIIQQYLREGLIDELHIAITTDDIRWW